MIISKYRSTHARACHNFRGEDMAPILEPYLEPGSGTLCHQEVDVSQVPVGVKVETQQAEAAAGG
jgi:hypothetical protein